jgi:outer membrane protein
VTKYIIPGTSLCALLISLICLFCITHGRSTIMYVDLNKLHNEFNMKKEMEQTFTKTYEKRKSIIDSLAMDIEALNRKVSNSPQDKNLTNHYNSLVEDYSSLRSKYEEDSKKQLNIYDGQIWNRINSYTADFRNQKGYKLIFGISGTGNLMAADSSLDATNDLLLYINKRYEGK